MYTSLQTFHLNVIVVVNNTTVTAVATKEPLNVYCSQCKTAIKQFRYYCSYCKTSTNDQGFQLCLSCFDHSFPNWHQHPRSSFAVQAVNENSSKPQDAILWEEDVMLGQQDYTMSEIDASLEASKVFTGATDTATQDNEGYLFLQKWKDRKICAFCNDDDDNSQDLGSFIGPFVSTIAKLGQERRRIFWAHDACARYSPEVKCVTLPNATSNEKWYNVTRALKRGRSMVNNTHSITMATC